MKIFLISFTALVLTVPWFFVNFDNKMILGFPIWALYSLLMTFIYAVIIAVLLGKYWEISADKDTSEEDV